MVNLSICIGSSCHLKGSYEIVQTFQKLVDENKLKDKVEMKATFCMKRCQKGVSVKVDDDVFSVSPGTAEDFFKNTVMPRID